MYYALVVGIDEDRFWELTPKTIQVYFKAYQKRREVQIQDLWRQGVYFTHAIASTLWFGKGKAPEYPKMPFEEENEEELAKDEKWLNQQRLKAMQCFTAILTKNKK